MQMLNPRMIGQSFALTSLSVLASCGFFKKSAPASVMTQADRPDSPEQQTYAPERNKSALDQLSLAWMNDDLNLKGSENEKHADECVKLCQPTDWLKLVFAFKQEELMILPSRIPGSIGLRTGTKINLSFEPQGGVKKQQPAFSCSFTRPIAEYGKEPKDYKFGSCSDGKKAFAIFKAQKITAAVEQSGLPEKIRSYTIGKSGSLQISCLNLPADPGKAGTATLLGVDSDKDGVRDDVQRWIVLNLPAEPKVQSLAKERQRRFQASISTTTPAAAKTAAVSELTNSTCLFSLVRKQVSPIISNNLRKEMRALELNSRDRFIQSKRVDSALSGSSIHVESEKECEQSFK